MEVVIPTMDFDFNSAGPSPYSSAPSTPKRFGEYYFSAPTSPTQLSEFYRDFDDFLVSSSSSSIPFDWEEKPGTPKSPKSNTHFEDDFAFDFSAESEKTTVPAEELFAGGKIRPLKPPPSRFGVSEASKSSITSQKSPISQIRGALSPRKKKGSDPIASPIENPQKRTEHERGRERAHSLSSSSRRATRSLSPYRVSKYPWEEEQSLQQQQSTNQPTNQSNSIIPKPALSSNSSSSKLGCRKWRLKDFFLFRSASEGRAADKDPLKKYTALFRKHEDVKSSSFRSIDGSSSKKRGAVSAHELHYTVNRAVSEDLKKKTFLPYKQGILGRLAFNPAVHALANGFGFSKK